MARFVKEIVRQGEFLVGTASGQRKRKKFQKSDLEHYASVGKEMLQSGLKIPAPRQHTTDAHPDLGENDPGEGYENLGYWENFYVQRDADGHHALYGVLNAPGDPEDDTTPAGKVSRTVKDTSICVHDFVDGTGKSWENAIWHVALPTHPIEPGQNNFTPLPDEYEIITMSQMVKDSDEMENKIDMGKLLTALSKCGISLPSDTTDDNVLERLYVAVTQKAESSGSGDSLSNKPNDSKVETYPIMMSLTQKQVEAILGADLIDPETGEKFAAEAFQDTKDDSADKLKESVVVMSNMLNDAYKHRYQDRVNNLVESGRVAPEYAKTHLLPMIESLNVSEAIQMGLAKDGKAPSNAVDTTLAALEALPAAAKKSDEPSKPNLWMSNSPSDSQSVPKPSELAVSDEEANELVKSILGQ